MAWSELGPTDADEIFRLIGQLEAADGSLVRTSREEVEGYFDDAMVWRAMGLRASDGSLLAFGLARMPGGGREVRLSGGVRPDARGEGIGRLLAAEQLRAARGIGGTSARVHVDDANAELAALLEREGFELSHTFVQMRMRLDEEDAAIPTPAHIRIEPLSPERDGGVVRFHNAVQAQAGGSAISPDAWAAEHAFIDRDWSFVAFDVRGDRPRIAAYIVCERFEQDWQAFGWSEGYISEVVLGREWRGLRLISLLLGWSMDAFRASGVSYAGIDVPEHDYLYSTYVDYGFEVTARTRVYVSNLDG